MIQKIREFLSDRRAKILQMERDIFYDRVKQLEAQNHDLVRTLQGRYSVNETQCAEAWRRARNV